jgi:ABC-type dipeptide/oligopeptide/nickel transport system permease component
VLEIQQILQGTSVAHVQRRIAGSSTSQVFNIPGVGRMLIQAVARRDYPVVQGAVMLAAGLYVLVNLVVDLLYGYLDPRLRVRGR